MWKSPFPLHPMSEKWGGLKLINNEGTPSSAKYLTAATTARRQHPAAILGGHAGAKAVYFAALALFGLKGAEHANTPYRK